MNPASQAETPRQTGALELVFAVRDGRTSVEHGYARPPFTLTRAFHPFGPATAHCILAHVSPGLFAGDDVATTIIVRRGARVILTSQSALQIHPARGAGARSRIEVCVEEGGELQCHFDPMIPFAGARLEQRTHIALGAGSRLLWTEGFMAGRIERGERWRFDRLDVETRVTAADRLAYLERFVVTGDRPATAPWSMSDFNYVGTLIAFGWPDVSPGAVQDALALAGPSARVGVDQAEPGLIVGRMLARGGVEFRRLRQRAQQLVSAAVRGAT